MTVDVDSTAVRSTARRRAAYGHTKVLGYHPRARRHRRGAASLGCGRDRLSAATAASCVVTVRADSGFFSYEMLDAIEDHQARYSITVAQAPRSRPPSAIDETPGSHRLHPRRAGVAESTVTTSARPLAQSCAAPASSAPRPSCGPTGATTRITDRDDLDTRSADAYHRGHARVELAIKDLKDNGLRLRTVLPGSPALAHKLDSPPDPTAQLTVAATVRPAPHSARTPPQAAATDCASRCNWPWRALGHRCSSDQQPRPGAARTPSATASATHTLTPHAPEHAGPGAVGG